MTCEPFDDIAPHFIRRRPVDTLTIEWVITLTFAFDFYRSSSIMVVPGDLLTEPAEGVIFKVPFSNKSTLLLSITNDTACQIGWVIRTESPRISTDPLCGVLERKEKVTNFFLHILLFMKYIVFVFF